MSTSLHEWRRLYLCPLPLWERATQRFNEDEWVRGDDEAGPALTPHPTEFVEALVLPSPTRGEGAVTAAAFAEALP
jgi:hypothetical protein